MPQHFDVLIVGGGHGGASAAAALRQHGFEGRVAIVSDEPEPPYERPPLSKEYFSGEKEFERTLIRPRDFWPSRNIQLMLGNKVVEVHPDDHRVGLSGGSEISYGKLIWATGGRARRLTCPGSDLRGMHTIRCRFDVDQLKAELSELRHVVVIGGGYIGLEAAAVLTKLAVQVTVLEAQDRVLARVAGAAISQFYEDEHRNHGVEIRTGVDVECIEGAGGRVQAVRLATGERLPAGAVIVGIGIEPAVEPLLHAGAQGSNGVLVDEHCRTSLPDVFAIGDCALHRNGYGANHTVRLESVQNANDQGLVAAAVIAGQPKVYDAVPWFWSNQYDLKLQTVGFNLGYDQTVTRGDPASRSFSVVYLRDGEVVALDCVNAVKDYVQGKRLVQQHARVAPDVLATTSLLKDIQLMEGA